MDIMRGHYLVVLVVLCGYFVARYGGWFEGIGGAIFSGLMSSIGFRCTFYECCTDSWIHSNFTGNWSKELFGQHLVMSTVIKHLKGHSKGQPEKPLVLSFHGSTGTGKGFTSRLVAEAMFVKGMDSQYVHLIFAAKEYPLESEINHYKDTLREKITQATTACPRALFIIDGTQMMPHELLDVLQPYLDYNPHVDRVDYRRTTFILISNTAGTEIFSYTNKQWLEGRQRELIQLKEMEHSIKLHVFNLEGQGFWQSELIKNELVTAYIPFLPLERNHVKKCVKRKAVKLGYSTGLDNITETEVQDVLDQLIYYPKDTELYAANGCKRVDDKIHVVMGTD